MRLPAQAFARQRVIVLSAPGPPTTSELRADVGSGVERVRVCHHTDMHPRCLENLDRRAYLLSSFYALRL
jgi:hypothetical protein